MRRRGLARLCTGSAWRRRIRPSPLLSPAPCASIHFPDSSLACAPHFRPCFRPCSPAVFSIYKIHDEKDKSFELELSWVCEESGWEHQRVPTDLSEAADAAGKQALLDADDA